MPMVPGLRDMIVDGLKRWALQPYNVECRHFVLYVLLPKLKPFGATDLIVQHRSNGETRFVVECQGKGAFEFDSSIQVADWAEKEQKDLDLAGTRKQSA